jgi:D-aminopeptidase
VGRIYDGAVAVAAATDSRIGVDEVVIPIVGECDDSWLSDSRVVQVEAADAARAVDAAGTAVAEGAVGAGTGMICFGWKGGVGTSSRAIPEVGATLGVLVLANFGSARELRIDGVPVGRVLTPPQEERPRPFGSCIAVIATDAPLAHTQLVRVARRAGLGLARTGSTAHHGSGEIFLALSTAPTSSGSLPDNALDPLFQATVDAAEEAVLNALWAAVDLTGRLGRRAAALPHDDVLDLLAAAQRLEGRGR